MNERTSSQGNEKLSPVLERLRRKTIYSEKDFKSPQQILQRSLELSKYRDNDPDAFIRETTILFSGFGRTKKTSDINVNDLIATLFVLRDNPDKTKYRFPDLVKQEEISLLIDSLLGKNLDFISNKKDSSIILPAYLILRSLKEDHSWWTWTQILGNRIIRQQTIELKNNLLNSIHTKKSRNILERRFKQSLNITEQKNEVNMPIIKIPLGLSRDKFEREEIKRKMYGLDKEEPKIPESFEVREAFFGFGTIFKDVKYGEKSHLILKKMLPNIDNEKALEKMATSFRQTYLEMENRQGEIRGKLDEAFNDELMRTGDFTKINDVILKTLYKNFGAKYLLTNKFKDFVNIPGIVEATDAIRKMYLLQNIKFALPNKIRQFIIPHEYRSLLSIDDVQAKLANKNIKNLFDDGELMEFIDHSDEELVNHFLFLAIEERIKNQEDDFNKRVFIKKDGDEYLVVAPDFLDPESGIKKINKGKIRIPMNPRFKSDNKDHAEISIYSQNRPITIIQINNIAYH